jgi:hypothetical protein
VEMRAEKPYMVEVQERGAIVWNGMSELRVMMTRASQLLDSYTTFLRVWAYECSPSFLISTKRGRT